MLDAPLVLPLEEFQRSIRERWAMQFQVLDDVLSTIEGAIGVKRSHRDDPVRLVVDMLFAQAYKGLVSVRLLSEHGHMEDAATIGRRLLELAAISGYVGVAELPANQLDRAERFLAGLWHDLPVEAHPQLPAAARAFFEQIAARRQRTGPLPSIQTMFSDIGHQDTYDQDYSLLAGISHGVSFDQLVAFSRATIPIRPIDHLGSVLAFSSRYALATTMIWNNHFEVIQETDLLRLSKVVTAWPVAVTPGTPRTS